MSPAPLDDLFDDDYLRFHGPWQEEVADDEAVAITELFHPLPRPAPVDLLDVGCGDARITARMRGGPFGRVVGLDGSATQLRHARGRAPELPLVRAGFAALPFADASFDLALCWFTSFGLGPDDDADRAALRECARVLRPGGVLILESVNRDQHVEAVARAEVLRAGDDDLMVDERRFDPHTGRLHVDRTYAVGAARHRHAFAMRLFTGPELVAWLRAAGFGPVALFGEDGEPFSVEHGRMIARAQMP